MQLLLFCVLFISLFLLSRALTATISLFFLRVTRNHGLAIQLLAILFLPGVILHELAHWLFASLLFVPTGEIEFFPQVQGDSVKLGSVQIAKTDPLRRFLIGVAPILFGLAVVGGIFSFFSPSLTQLTWATVIVGYTVFEIGNTMFSSAKDLEGVVIFIVLLALFLTLLVFLHIPIFAFLQQLAIEVAKQVFVRTLNGFFLVAIGIDVFVILLFRLLMEILRK